MEIEKLAPKLVKKVKDDEAFEQKLEDYKDISKDIADKLVD